jgi:hypothetical protein
MKGIYLHVLGLFILVTVLAGITQFVIGIPAVQTILTFTLLAIIILGLQVKVGIETLREILQKQKV